MSSRPSTIAHEEPSASPLSPPAFPARYACFGAFQADLEREELYQDGQRVKVQAKVFHGLQLLLSRAGDVVSREEVRRQLWPDTLLANLDANVNTTMNKLRQVLGDSPENPAYIETIPRRGYSFIANVEFSSVPGAPSTELVKTVLDATSQPGASGRAWSKKSVRNLLRVASLLFAGMILGALLAFVWFFAQAKNQRAANDAKVSASLTGCGFRRTSG
ncbi:MAG TPA: winged helix-turn-helix domain-containing protein [Candidatus Acidoferrum sp.]|nr:winged helix-turn-helix domain-containing protein [Candidatus Acidoferrum sp.]